MANISCNYRLININNFRGGAILKEKETYPTYRIIGEIEGALNALILMAEKDLISMDEMLKHLKESRDKLNYQWGNRA